MDRIASTLLIAAAGLLFAQPAGAQIKSTWRSAETIRTSTDYTSTGQRLTLHCDQATTGGCVFTVIDGPREKRFRLKPGGRMIVTHVSPNARACATGLNPGSRCDPAKISG